MQLYTYFRSSASYRVRIALNLKGLHADHIPVNLLHSAQEEASYRQLNPQGLIPTLVEDSGAVLTQSLAIMEYLDEAYPQTPLLPPAPLERARVRAIAQAIASEMAPLNNLRVLKYLTGELELPDEQKTRWYRHWIGVGFDAVEAMLNDGQAGSFCHGKTPGMADCCLVPQVYNARRFECDLKAYPTINRIYETCEAHPAFEKAHPASQPDAA